jgi:hypothetical protein
MDSSYIVITGATGWVGKTALDILLNKQIAKDSQYKIALFSSERSTIAISRHHLSQILHTLPLRDFPAFAEANSIKSYFAYCLSNQMSNLRKWHFNFYC